MDRSSTQLILTTKITAILESSFSIALTQPPTVLSVCHDIDTLLGFKDVDFLDGNVSLQSRIHEHDQDIANVLFCNEAQPATGEFNIRLRHADGRIRCIKGEYTKTLDHAGGVLLDLLLIDAKSLWQQHGDQTMMANFKAMMENTNDYIYFKDRNHVFTGASQTLVAITDPSEHWTDLIGKTDYDVFPEEYADIYYSLEKQVFAGIHVAHEEQETLDNQGNNGWVDNRKYPIRNDNGEIVGLFGIARDITENKRIADLLVRSETKFHTLFDSTGDAILMLDEKGFFDCNQAALTLFGLQSIEELRQYSPTDLSPTTQSCGTDSKQLAEKYINTAFQQGSVRFEWIHQRADSKKTFIADILLTSLSLDGKLFLQTTIRDITERKQAEFQTKLIIERSQHLLKLESFSEQMSEKEFMQHGQELAENLTGSQIAFIHFVNNDEETIELVAWSRRTVEHYCHAAFDSHYPVSKAGIWADALRNKQPVVFNDYATYPHKRGLPEGHSPLQRLISVPVIENGKVVMLTGVGNKETDYTETDIESVQLISNDIWRLVQRRRTERDQIIAATVFESQEGMLVTDANTNILRVNHAFTKITGYSAEEAIGQTTSLLKSGQHDDDFYASMWKNISSEGYWEGKIWNRRKNGEVYPEQLTITSVKNASGIVTNYVATRTLPALSASDTSGICDLLMA